MKTKKALLSLAMVLFAALAWYFFSLIFSGNSGVFGKGFAWIAFLVAIASSYAFAFLVALARDKFAFFIASLVSVLWILVFLGISAKTLLSAGGLFISTQVLLEFPGAIDRSLNIQYYVAAYAKSALVVLALLGITAAYIQDTVVSNIGQKEISQQTSNYAWPFISQYLGEFNSNETVDQYLAGQYKSQGVTAETFQMLAAQRAEMSRQIGLPVSGNDKMSDLGKKFFASRLNDFLQQYHVEKSGIYLIFFSMLILWPVGRMFLAGVSWLVYKIFRAAGLVKVKESQIIAKTLEV